MDLNTLTFYSMAAGLSVTLSAVLWIFAHFQPGTLVIRRWATGILVLSAAFFVSGIGPSLPRWTTVIGTNMALLSAGPILYSGFVAYGEERQATLDRWGWLMVMLTAPAFWYWGLIEPIGTYRSMVFSLVAAVVAGRIAVLLGRSALKRTGGVPTWVLALLFSALAVWMVGRVLLLWLAESPPPDLRGANPTTWVTVFGHIILLSLMSVVVMWMEVNRLKAGQSSTVIGFVEYFRNKLLLLWSTLILLVVGVVSMLGIGYVNIHDAEKARLLQLAEMTNDAFVEHTVRVVHQVDTILQATRAFFLYSGSMADTEIFIRSFGFDHSVIDNVGLLSAEGRIAIAHDSAVVGRSMADREYFLSQKFTLIDQIVISPVEPGRSMGQLHFYLSRRISRADDHFDGLVLAMLNPDSLARHFRELAVHSLGSFVSLLGTADRKLRAHLPELPAEQWLIPVESPLWDELDKAPAGHYESTSPIDHIRRIQVFRKIPGLPLVMQSGFSSLELTQSIHERMRWLVLSSLSILGFTLALALLLTIESKRRDEQDHFMSMLSHELKTPMSVIRLAIGIGGLPADIKGRVSRAVSDMHAVIERCLLSDRLQHGRVTFSPMSCSLVELLEEVCTSCVAPERLVIRAEHLPSCRTDRQLLTIILSNLVDNALKYALPASQVDIRAEAVEHRGHPGIRIDVANVPGPAGMPDPQRVFTKYYRAAAAHGKTGSGLGLHIASGLARKLDGWLRYRPKVDEVRFELWIPL